MAAIRAEGLYKVFGRRADDALKALQSGEDRKDVVASTGATPAVIDASFEVQAGEIFVVMGLSGSGKSTLIRMLNGLWDTIGGHVYIDGDDISGLSPADLRTVRQEKMSMVFQHFALLPHRTVVENAMYALNVRRVGKDEAREKAVKALEMVGLAGWEEKYPSQLSGGMKQRVGLARALAAETDIMLMDEAFSALDPLIRRGMQEQLVELQQQLGKTIVFITHDLNEAMLLGDRIAMMRDGRIEQIGSAEEILNDPANDYVAEFVSDVDRTRVLTASNVMEPTKALVVGPTGPRNALRVMRENQTSVAVVVGRDRRLEGVITDESAMSGMNKGLESLDGLLDTDVPSVSENTVLADLFGPSVESGYALAVVDDDNRLLGVIPRVTLLASMASLSSTANGNGSGGDDGGGDELVGVETSGGQ